MVERQSLSFSGARKALEGAMAGAALAALLIVFPALGIRKGISIFSWHWQELAACALLISFSAVMLARISCADKRLATMLFGEHLDLAESFAELNQEENHKAKALMPTGLWRQRVLPAAGLFYVFLYCSACVLCERLNLGLIPEVNYLQEPFRSAGLLVLTLGLFLQLKTVMSSLSQAVTEETTNTEELSRFVCIYKVRHPIFLGWLLILTGIAMSFGGWLPLLAIPGTYVGIKWRLRAKEVSLRQKFGDTFVELEKRTWLLLPHLPDA